MSSLLQQIINKNFGSSGHSSYTNALTNNTDFTSGLLGGALSGGALALLFSHKKSRNLAKKLAKYGGAAVLGGLAYRAFANWQNTKAEASNLADGIHNHHQTPLSSNNFKGDGQLEMTLLQTMISASKADGNVDEQEYQKIFGAIGRSSLSTSEKAAILATVSKPLTPAQIATLATCPEQKAEVYLAARIPIILDDPREVQFLEQLAVELQLPKDLRAQLDWQFEQSCTE